MKMKEVCALTGLSERAVRLYCEEGLLTPERNEVRGRVYLEFSEVHIEALQQIADLRAVGFSLEEIRTAQNEPHLIGRLIGDLRTRLEREQGEGARAIAQLKSAAEGELPADIGALCAALKPKRAYTNSAVLRDGEESFRAFCEREGYAERTYTGLDRNIARGRVVMTVYGVLYWLSYAIVILGLLAANGLDLFPIALYTAGAVLLFIYLYRGVGWIRGVLSVLAFFEAILAFGQAAFFLPGKQVVHSVDINGVTQTTIEKTGSWWLVAAMLLLAVIYAAVVYFLGFNRWVSDYLYDRASSR